MFVPLPPKSEVGECCVVELSCRLPLSTEKEYNK